MWEPEPGERVISACRDPTPQHRVKARVMPSTIPSPSTLAPAADRSLALKAAAGVLFVAVVALSWVLGHGSAGPGYLVLYALLLLPGLPLGFLLFGRGHAAGWIAGALIGYGLSAIVLWIPVDLGFAGHAWAPTAWAALTAATHLIARGSQAVVVLPQWHRGDTAGLLCALLVVPLLVAGPFSRVGERDPAGNLRYRAYFTADFLWHVALTAELAKADPPIRNPYLERRALNYYWAVLRAAGDDRQKCRGSAFARGLPAAQRALRRAAVRCLHLSLRLVCGSPGRPDSDRSPSDHAGGQRRRPSSPSSGWLATTCHSPPFGASTSTR